MTQFENLSAAIGQLRRKRSNSKYMVSQHQIVLFICTGNFYRSRFAEQYLNARAVPTLGWRAESRGFRLSTSNVGPVAVCVPDRLAALGLHVVQKMRFPLQLQEEDLARASRIIALDEMEHRLYVETLFPTWRHRINYWRVPDADRMHVEEALYVIEREVDSLLAQLTTVDHIYAPDRSSG